ncbi:MAG TPA: HesA/MoeB/ThiF family protein [Thermoleophilaceae bacterium]|jgi:molybdopterin/thiamine biosynthesis adenylyltransferase|nr:HesA/MoeB/ThiF family protein [Thermoleophilaceae bacterium]
MDDRELERYARQLVLPEWTGQVQERLRASTAIVVGAGALGSPAATYLACAGVGRIGVADGDWVELSNLNRQPLHFTPDVETQKAESAAQKLGVLNTEISVEPYPVELDSDNAAAIVAGADVVLDCTDSFETRYLINQACCGQRIPLVEAGALGFGGMVFAIRPGETACYRCAFPTAPANAPSCAEAGMLGAVAGAIGSLQALEALKLLSGVGTQPGDTILQFDGLTLRQTLVRTSRRPDCTACAELGASPQSSP